MRVLIVEDEAELAMLIGQALGEAGFATDIFASLGEAEAAVAAVRYDLLMLDLGLPDGDGLALLRRLRAGGAGTPILVATARDDLEDRVAGLDAGADDYVLKPFHIPELISRVKALLRRPNAALGITLTAGNVTFDTIGRVAVVGAHRLALSAREFALLELLMRRLGRVVSKGAIEESLYGFEDEIGSNAVEVLTHRLRKKLQKAGATSRIHTLRGVGYMLADTSE